MDYLNQINKYIQKINADKENVNIFFVTNVVGETKINDYSLAGDSILTEYFTEDEYNVMIDALRANFKKLTVFFNEDNFIDFILKNEKTIDKDNLIVFNLARNGKGVNKKSLIPSFCEAHNIKYTGSNAYQTCLGRHKYHYNLILSQNNINVAKTWVYTGDNWLLDNKPDIGLKIIVKPMFESASRGVNENSILVFKDSMRDLEYIKKISKEYEQDVIVQEFIEGYEVQVPIIHTTKPYALNPVGISMNGDELLGDKIITFDIAFTEEYSFYNYALNDLQLKNLLQENSIKAFKALGLTRYSRFDYRVSEKGEFKITDISTHPYLIHHSAFAFAFEKLNFSYDEIFLYLIAEALYN